MAKGPGCFARRAAALPRSVPGAALLSLAAAVVLWRTAPEGVAQSACAVTGERLYSVLEPRPVQWGGEVDIDLDLTVSCHRRSQAEGMTITEPLPAGLVVEPGIGTAPLASTPAGVVWRVQPVTQTVDVRYRLVVTPDPAVLEPSGVGQVYWPMELALTVAGRTEPVAAPEVDPLTVARRPGARSCELEASVDPSPASVLVGTPFVTTIDLLFERCRFPGLRQRAVIALQPSADAAFTAAAITGTASLAGFLAGYQPSESAMTGVLVNGAGGPTTLEATEDLGRVLEAIRATAPSTGGDATAAIRGALGLLADWPYHHEVVYYFTHGQAPAADAADLSRALAGAADRGVEVVTVCVGGGCDPALAVTTAIPGWQALPNRLEHLVADHLGPVQPVQPLTVDTRLPSYLDLIAGSVAPAAEVTGTAITWRGLAAVPGQHLSVQFAARPSTWGRLPVGASTSVESTAADGRTRDSTLLLPGFVSVARSQPSGQPCLADISKTASPARLPLGAFTTVELDLRPECSDLDNSIDVVLSLDRSGSMGVGIDYDYVKLAAKALVGLLDIQPGAGRRFGLTVHGDPPVVAVPLTDNSTEIDRLIDAMAAAGQDNLAESIEQGTQMLLGARPAHGPAPRDVLVVISDGGQTHPPASALPPAEDAKRAGIVVVPICARTASSDCPLMASLASDPSSAMEVDHVYQVLERLVELGLSLRQADIGPVEVHDDLPPDMRLVPMSLDPPAEAGQGGRLVWRMDSVSPLGTSLRYEVQPLRLGRRPTNTWADVQFSDDTGRKGYGVFGVPEVEVLAEPPSGSCVASLAVAAPDEVPLGQSFTSTLAAGLVCPRVPVPLDAVLAIDHSASMGTEGRMQSVKSAANAFLDVVGATGAWVGLVAFNEEVTEKVPLTPYLDQVRRAVDGLRAEGLTSLAVPLLAAHDMFRARRTESQAVIVLLTDGRTQGSMDTVVAAADAAKQDGILVVTYCAGWCDPELPRVASRPDLAVQVADAGELAELYRELATELAYRQVHDVSVEELLPDGLQAVFGSAAPAPAEGPAAGRTLWRFGGVPSEGITVTQAITAVRTGEMPVGAAWLTYGFGPTQTGRATFPERLLRVAGPVPSTATPQVQPTFPSPSPSPTGRPTIWPPRGRVCLPAAYRS
jgi:Mg-chelatase subunit ChlD